MLTDRSKRRGLCRGSERLRLDLKHSRAVFLQIIQNAVNRAVLGEAMSPSMYDRVRFKVIEAMSNFQHRLGIPFPEDMQIRVNPFPEYSTISVGPANVETRRWMRRVALAYWQESPHYYRSTDP